MRAHIQGNSLPALLMGGLLASAGHAVSADTEVPRLRLGLPSGWLAVSLSSARGLPAPEVLLCGEAMAEQSARQAEAAPDGAFRLTIRSGTESWWSLGAVEGEGECAALFDVASDGSDFVEIVSSSPAIVVPQDGRLRRLWAPLRGRGLRVEEAKRTRGHCAALVVARLLDLPVALCNTTREVFLSSADGRRIAEVVLEEGLRVMEKAGIALARLSWRDPEELLRELRRRPEGLNAFRYDPGHEYSPALQALLRGDQAAAHVPQRGLVRRAREMGVAVDWNWRLLGVLPRISRAGFLASPADLLRAIA